MRRSALDVYLALYATLYGLWLLLPMDSFGQTPVFAGLRAIAPEWAWGVVIAGSGALKLLAIWRGRVWQRRVLLFWLFLLWSFLAWSAALSSTGSTAVPTYVLAALGFAYCYLRAGRV